MADLAWFSALFIVLCSSSDIVREPLLLAKERERVWYLNCPCVPCGSRVSFIGEEEERKKERKKERRKKIMTIFDFFKIRFLGFYKTELKSKDIFVLRRVRAFHSYPFCWLLDANVKTFQPPSSLHRDRYRDL